MLRGMTRRSAASRSFLSRPRRALIPAAAGCAALLLIAGCGQAKSAAATAPSSASSARSSMTAYLTCLRQHGVNVPTARPTVRPTARPTGGFGAGSTTMQKARQACASLRPAGGFGFGGGQFAAAFQAFRTCMASHGVTIPTTRPTAPHVHWNASRFWSVELMSALLSRKAAGRARTLGSSRCPSSRVSGSPMSRK